MKTQKFISASTVLLLLFVLTTVLLVPGQVLGDWLMTNNPPDVDKADHGHGNKPSCWVTSAADMLAGAGYGDGSTPQQRADEIYDEMCELAGIDCNNSGWTDTAMNIWLSSANNTWKQTNPLSVVGVLGPANCKNVRNPWTKTDLPMFIGNELRKGNPIGLSTLKSDRTFGHAITAWGDANDANTLTGNPDKIKVTDSDYWDIYQAIQTYTYDDYNHPNPGDGNQGVGWYFNYNFSDDNHRYIDHCYAISVTSYDFSNYTLIRGTKKYIGSYKIRQDHIPAEANALNLRYKFKSDSILNYRTTIDWDNNNVPPSITENNNPPTVLQVYWNLNQHPVPYDTNVTITTEAVLSWDWGTLYLDPRMSYEDVNFGYLGLIVGKPGFGWSMGNTVFSTPVEPNATGGYVVGAFDIYDTSTNPKPIAQYRLISQYGYNEDPEQHIFLLGALPQPPQSQICFVGNFRFGQSYAFLDDKALWAFDQWRFSAYTSQHEPIGKFPPPIPPPPAEIQIQISFPRVPQLPLLPLLPYPKGQDFTNPTPEKCGDPGTWYVSGDINKDCRVDLKDMAILAGTWLRCTDPQDANCW